MVWGGGKGLRRVGGAILALLDHTLVVDVVVELSSVVEDGGGRSPYKPPSIVCKLGPFIDSATGLLFNGNNQVGIGLFAKLMSWSVSCSKLKCARIQRAFISLLKAVNVVQRLVFQRYNLNLRGGGLVVCSLLVLREMVRS
ncbi:Uncharacterized protein Fot_38168 [Forsythia ovata]|uniref:Uncharacterized protein n=1 Tax=Forsythia ovata TaxID=205694 RepID=A0ABD1S121_9LAMI